MHQQTRKAQCETTYSIVNIDTIADNDEEELSQPWFARHALENGIKILDSDSNWNRLLYKEALCIERNDPSLNRGLKASRQLKLFR